MTDYPVPTPGVTNNWGEPLVNHLGNALDPTSGFIKEGAVMASDAAPIEDAGVANKKYVDDQIAAKTQSAQAVGTSNISNTTGDWADMADMSITITTTGGNVLLMFAGTMKLTPDGIAEFRFEIVGSDTSGAYRDTNLQPYNNRTREYLASFQYLVTGLAAGEHTFKVKWKNAAGTISQDGATYARVFTAVELP